MRAFFSWTEARRFYSIGLPIFIAQLSQTGMNFADTAMTGQYNAEDMAVPYGRRWPCSASAAFWHCRR